MWPQAHFETASAAIIDWNISYKYKDNNKYKYNTCISDILKKKPMDSTNKKSYDKYADRKKYCLSIRYSSVILSPVDMTVVFEEIYLFKMRGQHKIQF